MRFVRLLVAPAHFQYWLYAFTTFSAIHIAQTMVNTGQNFAVIARFARCILTFPVPLQPASGVGN
ncbi:hypothetical protein D3C81_1886370 [compost metagenome]